MENRERALGFPRTRLARIQRAHEINIAGKKKRKKWKENESTQRHRDRTTKVTRDTFRQGELIHERDIAPMGIGRIEVSA